jgi:DNA-binding protein Fis
MILEENPLLTPSSLPVSLVSPGASGDGVHPQLAYQIPDEGISLEENERSLVVRALEKTSGNQTQAARLLSITRDTLRYKMKKFSLK